MKTKRVSIEGVSVPVRIEEPGAHFSFDNRVSILGAVLRALDHGDVHVELSPDAGTVFLDAFKDACAGRDVS